MDLEAGTGPGHAEAEVRRAVALAAEADAGALRAELRWRGCGSSGTGWWLGWTPCGTASAPADSVLSRAGPRDVRVTRVSGAPVPKAGEYRFYWYQPT